MWSIQQIEQQQQDLEEHGDVDKQHQGCEHCKSIKYQYQ